MVAGPTEHNERAETVSDHNERAETAAIYNRFRLFAVIIGILLVAVISFLVIVLPDNFSATNPIVNPPSTNSVGSIVSDPSKYYGNYTQVTGKITQIVSDHGFVITDNSGQQLLVVGFYPLPISLYGNSTVPPTNQNLNQFNGQTVQVAGTVNKFDIYNMSSTINYTLNPSAYNSWVGKPALVADQVNTSPSTSGYFQVNNLSVDQVLKNPAQYTDILVTINGVTGQNITEAGGHAFVLGQTASDNSSSGNAILVVGNTDVMPTQSFQTLNPGTKVTVTGTFRQFDLTIATEAIGQTVPSSVFSGWGKKYILLATQIQKQGNS